MSVVNLVLLIVVAFLAGQVFEACVRNLRVRDGSVRIYDDEERERLEDEDDNRAANEAIAEMGDGPPLSDAEVKLSLSIETERESDGRWIAEVTDAPGVMAYGNTRQEAVGRALLALAREVIAAADVDAWLRVPNTIFGGACPGDFSNGTPAQQLMLCDVLLAAKHGVFS